MVWKEGSLPLAKETKEPSWWDWGKMADAFATGLQEALAGEATRRQEQWQQQWNQ